MQQKWEQSKRREERDEGWGNEQQMEAGVLIRGGDANEKGELPLNMLISST